jgi:hypothetical protein
MVIRFKISTKPAFKGTIAVFSYVLTVYVATHALNWYGTSHSLLIGIISVLIGTYQMPPFCASCTSLTITLDAVSTEGIEAQVPHPILTCVFGKPTHKQIKTIIHKLPGNLIAIPVHGATAMVI